MPIAGISDEKLKSDNFVQKSTGWHSMVLNSNMAWKWEIVLIKLSLAYRCQRGRDWSPLWDGGCGPGWAQGMQK